VAELDRDALVTQCIEAQQKTDARKRELVVKYGRRDVLAKILGYGVQPFHLAMMHFAATHKDSLHLAFRGSGKSTVLTVVGVIFDMIMDPEVRICIASETQGHASDLLREIKGHLEGNDDFRRIFGDLVGETWNEEEIIISSRTRPKKEPTVMAVGIGGQVVGKHFDRIYGDDLVTEENARTEIQREKLKVWWYKSFKPTFEPHACVKVIGTRYHFDDLYGHFITHEFKECYQVIKALERRGDGWATPWPEKFSVQYFLDLWAGSGTIIFNSQYQCDAEAMRGEIFQYDWMDFVDPAMVPASIRGFAGVDLCVKDKEQNDLYARVGIGVTKDGHIYVITSKDAHSLFSQQTSDIVEAWQSGLDGWFKPGSHQESQLVEIGVEAVAYQDSQVQRVREVDPTIQVVPVNTLKDKVTRAWKLQPLFENGKIHFVGPHNRLVDALVRFPNGNKDLFDALDIAITTAFRPRRRRRQRQTALGVI
jgi:phage terminase large subunit-like protein